MKTGVLWRRKTRWVVLSKTRMLLYNIDKGAKMNWLDKFKANLLEVLYRPDQPRDERGRWVAAGGGSAAGDVKQDHAGFVERAKLRSAQAAIERFQGSYMGKFGDLSQAPSEEVTNTATNARELHDNAKAVEGDFREVMHGAAEAAGGEAYFGPTNPKTGTDFALKDYDSLEDKITRRGKPVEQLSDAVRGTVIVPEVDNLKSAVDAVKADVEARGGKIVQIEDKYASPMETGYVGIHIDAAFSTPDGGTILAEIQVHDHNFTHKENSHVLYEQNRRGAITKQEMIIKTVDMYRPWYESAI